MPFSENPAAERDWETIRDAASSDSDKAHAYNRLANYHNNAKLEFETALRYALEAERYFRKCSDHKNIADSLYIAGEASYRLENFTDALGYFNTAADLVRAEIDQFFLAICVDRIADCYSKLNQNELAVANYRNSAKMHEVESNYQLAALQRLAAAESLNEAEAYAEAELEATLAIELLEKAETTTDFARAHNIRAFAFKYQKQYALAIKDFDAAINLAGFEEDCLIDSGSYYHKAECLFELRRFEECQSNISLARKAFKKSGFAKGKAVCVLLAAKVAFEMADFDLAESLAQKARPFFSHSNEGLLAECDYLLAKIEDAKGNKVEALERYEIAIESLQKLSNPKPERFQACVDYAAALIFTPNLQRAIEVLNLVPHVEFLSEGYQVASHNIRARAHYLLNQYDRCFEVLEQVFAITGEDFESEHYAFAIETKARASADSGSPDALSTMQYAVNVLAGIESPNTKYLVQQLRELQASNSAAAS